MADPKDGSDCDEETAIMDEYVELERQMTKIDAMLTAIEQKNDSFQSQAWQLLEEMREAKRENSQEKQTKPQNEDSRNNE